MGSFAEREADGCEEPLGKDPEQIPGFCGRGRNAGCSPDHRDSGGRSCLAPGAGRQHGRGDP